MECANDEYLEIYPDEKTISQVHVKIPCPWKNCNIVLNAWSSLNMHVAKHHENPISSIPSAKQRHFRYRCPSRECRDTSSKYFSDMKLLRAHYQRTHADKKFGCGQCCKQFATISMRNAHQQFCGVEFKCGACGNVYNMYQALLTHCKRKKHACKPKSAYRLRKSIKHESASNEYNEKSSDSQASDSQTKEAKNMTYTIQFDSSNPKKAIDIVSYLIHYQNTSDSWSNLTIKVNDPRFEAASKERIQKDQRDQVSSSVQTMDFADKQDEYCSDKMWSSAGTQTVEKIRFRRAIIPTECRQSSPVHSLTNDKNTFDNRVCNNETQTESSEKFFEDFDRLLCSDIYTQTCEGLLMSLNNETQTAWSHNLRDDSVSAETQTCLGFYSTSLDVNLNNNETQTDYTDYCMEEVRKNIS